jgi:hypothetical protein
MTSQFMGSGVADAHDEELATGMFGNGAIKCRNLVGVELVVARFDIEHEEFTRVLKFDDGSNLFVVDLPSEGR